MNCEHCGAAIKDDGAFCSHCGTRRKRQDAPTKTTDPARFDLARQSPRYEPALNHVPRVDSDVADAIVPVVMIGFAVFFVGMAFSMGAVTDHPFGLLFVVVPGLMIALAIKMLAARAQFARAPITRELLVVVDERTATSGGGDTSVRTSYFATLQGRDGTRTEYSTYGWVAGKIAAGDIGVAFLKGGRLIDFKLLDA